MAIDDKIIDENLQYDINRKTVKISALSSCLTGKEMLPSNRSQIKKTFTYSLHINLRILL